MYTPRAFALDDLPELHQLIQHTRLAQLVTVGEQGLQASHLPLLLKPDEGPHGTLYGHLAKANRQWQDLQSGSQALVIFASAEAYVSPSFYPAKAEHGKVVPTWNYLAVHAYGQADVFTGRLHSRHAQGHRRFRPAHRAFAGQAQTQPEPQRSRHCRRA
jgi:transcriptional regulator